MKKIKFFTMAITVMFLAFVAASCSSSDNDDNSNSIVGKWKITSCTQEDFYKSGSTNNEIVFETDGKVSGSFLDEYYKDRFTGNYRSYYARWTMKGDSLTIVLGNSKPDDQMVGKVSNDGKNATYNYYWQDCDTKRIQCDGEHFLMKLEKQ